MRRIAGLSKRKPLKKPAAKVRKAPPKRASRSASKALGETTIIANVVQARKF